MQKKKQEKKIVQSRRMPSQRTAQEAVNILREKEMIIQAQTILAKAGPFYVILQACLTFSSPSQRRIYLGMRKMRALVFVFLGMDRPLSRKLLQKLFQTPNVTRAQINLNIFAAFVSAIVLTQSRKTTFNLGGWALFLYLQNHVTPQQYTEMQVLWKKRYDLLNLKNTAQLQVLKSTKLKVGSAQTFFWQYDVVKMTLAGCVKQLKFDKFYQLKVLPSKPGWALQYLVTFSYVVLNVKLQPQEVNQITIIKYTQKAIKQAAFTARQREVLAEYDDGAIVRYEVSVQYGLDSQQPPMAVTRFLQRSRAVGLGQSRALSMSQSRLVGSTGFKKKLLGQSKVYQAQPQFGNVSPIKRVQVGQIVRQSQYKNSPQRIQLGDRLQRGIVMNNQLLAFNEESTSRLQQLSRVRQAQQAQQRQNRMMQQTRLMGEGDQSIVRQLYQQQGPQRQFPGLQQYGRPGQYPGNAPIFAQYGQQNQFPRGLYEQQNRQNIRGFQNVQVGGIPQRNLPVQQPIIAQNMVAEPIVPRQVGARYQIPEMLLDPRLQGGIQQQNLNIPQENQNYNIISNIGRRMDRNEQLQQDTEISNRLPRKRVKFVQDGNTVNFLMGSGENQQRNIRLKGFQVPQRSALSQLRKDPRFATQAGVNNLFSGAMNRIGQNLYLYPNWVLNQTKQSRLKNQKSIIAGNIANMLKSPDDPNLMYLSMFNDLGLKFNASKNTWQATGKGAGVINRPVNSLKFNTNKMRKAQKSSQLIAQSASNQMISSNVPQIIKVLMNANQDLSNTGIGPKKPGGIPLYAGRWIDSQTGSVRIFPKASSKFVNPLNKNQRLAYLQARILNKWNQFVDVIQTYAQTTNIDPQTYLQRGQKKIASLQNVEKTARNNLIRIQKDFAQYILGNTTSAIKNYFWNNALRNGQVYAAFGNALAGLSKGVANNFQDVFMGIVQDMLQLLPDTGQNTASTRLLAGVIRYMMGMLDPSFIKQVQVGSYIAKIAALPQKIDSTNYNSIITNLNAAKQRILTALTQGFGFASANSKSLVPPANVSDSTNLVNSLTSFYSVNRRNVGDMDYLGSPQFKGAISNLVTKIQPLQGLTALQKSYFQLLNPLPQYASAVVRLIKAYNGSLPQFNTFQREITNSLGQQNYSLPLNRQRPIQTQRNRNAQRAAQQAARVNLGRDQQAQRLQMENAIQQGVAQQLNRIREAQIALGVQRRG